MAKLKLGVLGSGAGSNMQSIVDAIEAGTLDAEICLVLADFPDAKILDGSETASPVRLSPKSIPRSFPFVCKILSIIKYLSLYCFDYTKKTDLCQISLDIFIILSKICINTQNGAKILTSK